MLDTAEERARKGIVDATEWNLWEYPSWGDEGYFVCRHEWMQHVQQACSDTYTLGEGSNLKDMGKYHKIFNSYILHSPTPLHVSSVYIHSIIDWQHITAALTMWCLIAVAAVLRFLLGWCNVQQCEEWHPRMAPTDSNRACNTICLNAIWKRRS